MKINNINTEIRVCVCVCVCVCVHIHQAEDTEAPGFRELDSAEASYWYFEDAIKIKSQRLQIKLKSKQWSTILAHLSNKQSSHICTDVFLKVSNLNGLLTYWAHNNITICSSD